MQAKNNRRSNRQRMPAAFDASGQLSVPWMLAAGYRQCDVCGRWCDPQYWKATGGKCLKHSSAEGRQRAGAFM